MALYKYFRAETSARVQGIRGTAVRGDPAARRPLTGGHHRRGDLPRVLGALVAGASLGAGHHGRLRRDAQAADGLPQLAGRQRVDRAEERRLQQPRLCRRGYDPAAGKGGGEMGGQGKREKGKMNRRKLKAMMGESGDRTDGQEN